MNPNPFKLAVKTLLAKIFKARDYFILPTVING